MTTPPFPIALQPAIDEALRPTFAGGERDVIAQRLRATRRNIWMASAIGGSLPILPIVLFWNDAAVFERLFAYHPAAGIVGMVGTLIGVAAPLWATVRLIFDVPALRRYQAMETAYTDFLRQEDRCPLDARTAKRQSPSLP